MRMMYEDHCEPTVSVEPSINPELFVEMNVIIYDSVRKDYAISVSWQDDCLRREWGIVIAIDRVTQKIKLLRDDGNWWIPLN